MPAFQSVGYTMPERDIRIPNRENTLDPIECNASQTNDHFGLNQLDLTLQIWLAIIQLFSGGLVLRRRAGLVMAAR